MDFDIFTLDGRVRRTHYLAYMFILTIASYAIQLLASLIASGDTALALTLIAQLPIYWAFFCVAARRAHDWGTSAAFVVWMYIAMIAGFLALFGGMSLTFTQPEASIPAVGLGAILLVGSSVMSLILLFAPPSDDNEWGADPR